MKTIAIAVTLALVAGCATLGGTDDPKIAEQFIGLCHMYQQPGFDAQLKELLPQGSPASRCRTLLSRADKVGTKLGMTVYTFDPGHSLGGGQGLMVFIYVDQKSKIISKVKWAVAGH